MKAVTLALLAVPLFVPVLAASGCGNDIDEGDAQDGWRATNLAIASTEAQIATEVDAEGGVVLTATCPSGGSARYDGSYGSSDDFALEITFDKCKAGGVSTTGDLSYAGSIEVETGSEGSSSRVELSYSGHLRWTGDIKGECSLDATLLVESSVGNGMVSANVEARGTMCGYSADVVVGGSL